MQNACFETHICPVMDSHVYIMEGSQEGSTIKGSQPISRVLSRAIIHLDNMSPCISSNLPGNSADHALCSPIWSCSEWGLPCHKRLPVARCALTAPFHPYLTYHGVRPLALTPYKIRRFIFCCTFRRLSPPRRYLALCPMEPGLSSPKRITLWRDCLANSRV